MGGFHTLDESHAFAHFRRGRVFHVLGHVKLSGVTYDWTGSLFNEDTIIDHTVLHADPDAWSGGGGNPRAVNTQNYRVTLVPFVDSSSGTATLKLASVGHAGHSADDFQSVATGAQAAGDGGGGGGGGTNNHLVVLTTTGVTFSGNNMVDGEHLLQWKHKHDAKTDTHFTTSAVLKAADNVLSAYASWQSHSSLQSGNYVDATNTVSGGLLRWQATWDPDDNTWTVNTSDDDWQQANNANVSVTTDGGSLTKETTQYSITGSSPADGRMWEITVGTT